MRGRVGEGLIAKATQMGLQAAKSLRTRKRVVQSTVRLIRKEGLASASPVRIARDAGFSWGAVQHHFGSKELLLHAIVAGAREEFVETIAAQDFSGLDLAARVSKLVDVAWGQYRGDMFLAAIEIAFWHRNNRIAFASPLVDAAAYQDHEVSRVLARAFEGLGVKTDVLLEASLQMHCVLTGIAYQEILSGEAMPAERHLNHCKRTIEGIIRGTD